MRFEVITLLCWRDSSVISGQLITEHQRRASFCDIVSFIPSLIERRAGSLLYAFLGSDLLS